MSRVAGLRFDQLQAANPIYKEAWGRARAVAAGRAHMLLRGHVGSGRLTLARAVHLESPRREGPFVAAFVTSEERSTPRWVEEQIARARGGTLYLSDPVDLYDEASSYLAERFAERPDVRLIASTRRVAFDFDMDPHVLGRDLRDLAGDVVVDLPPLCERPEDVVPLFLQFAAETAAAFGRPAPEACTEGAQRVLLEYEWPGNLLELRVVASQAAQTAVTGGGTAADLAIDGVPANAEPAFPLRADRETEALRRHALGVLHRFGGDVDRSAQALGVSRSALYRKMKRYRIGPADLGRPTPSRCEAPGSDGRES